MSASNQIHLVTDAGIPVTVFRGKRELQAYLRRRLDTFAIPPVYKFRGDGCARVTMTTSRALAD
jgi:hypothetical protein